MKAKQHTHAGLFRSIAGQALALWQSRTLPTALFVFSLLSVLVFWTQLGRMAWLGKLMLVLTTCALAFVVAAFLIRAVFVFHLQQANHLLAKTLNEERSRLAKLEQCLNGFFLELVLDGLGEISVLDVQVGVERFLPVSSDLVRRDWGVFISQVEPKYLHALQAALYRPGAFPARDLVVFGLKRRAGESPIYLQMTLLRQTSELGTRLLAVCVDVTDLALARQMAEKADLAKTEFLATMSHELRTPLNAIAGFARLLEDQLDTGSQLQNDAKSISVAASSLNHILTDILDFSRVEARGVQLDQTAFDINAIVRQVHVLNKPLADHKKLEFICLADETNPLWVSGDFNRLRQIIQNLVSNALKFTNHGFVRLKLAALRSDNDRVDVFIEVADSGIGIGQTSLRKLFKRFSQANRSINREFGGTGLGLAISKGLVELMGGRIDVTSEPGVGSVFTVFLNLPIAAPVAPPTEVRASQNEKARLSILLVDDHAMNLKLLDRYLSRREHRVVCALSGVEAFELSRGCAFDLVLMDIDMPEMDGYQTTKAIRLDEGNPNKNTLVCALSGLSDEASKQLCFEAGMQHHLSKPVPFDQLDHLLQTLCESKLTGQATLASL